MSTLMDQQTGSPEPPAPDSGFAGRIAQMAAVVSSAKFPAGDRASFRRHAPGRAPSLAYHRFWPRWMNSEPPAEAQSQDWALIIFGLALGGDAVHQRAKSLGAALAEAGYSDARLERLLAAEEQDLRRQAFARALRFLAAKNQGFDWVGAAAWLLGSGDTREKHARRIATDFYRAQPRPAQNADKE